MMQCLHFLVEPAKTFAFHVKESRNKAKDERAEPLVESQVFIMELAKDLHRVCQRSDVLEHIWTCEDVWPATVCQAFIINCASLLDGKVAGRLEGGNQSGPHLDSQETGGGREADAAKLAILEWTSRLKKLPEDSLWPGQAVVEILDDIAINWQKGCVSSLQPAVELLLWATLTEGLDKEAIPQKWLVWKQRIKNIDAIPYIPQKVWNWIREAAVEVTLDAETANPDLVLSPDERRMHCGFERQDLVNHPQRFDGWWCALGLEGFSAGRRYWEVEVGDRDWRLGVAKASAFRKGFKSLNTASGYLTLRLERGSEMKALTVPFTALAPSLGIPQKVGVYLDYEKGQLSFYDAKNCSHIYTYNETFSEELYPLFGTVEIINDMVIWSPGAPEPRCPGICVWG